ncbi:MAG: molybdopterin-dependent oxidoreductase [Desulfobacterales bacterium]|nr:molybdopterin-dependent oxidoreductase [Desulfobacterales bacterium]
MNGTTEKRGAMKEDRKISRRTFLAGAGGAIVSIGLPGVFVKLADAEQRALAEDTRPDGRPRLPPGQVAVERIRDMGGAPGTATVANWTLRVHGEVERPVILSYRDLLNLDQMHITCDIHCVTGWTLLDSRWSGVRLSTILDRVKPRRSADFVIFEAAGDYTSSIPMSEARKEDVILAHSFFGEKLQQAHGAPVRALVPDRYFYKSAKWMEAVKITSRDEPGFWEKQGYSNSADPWKEERYEQGR